jgi:hypothetical protein
MVWDKSQSNGFATTTTGRSQWPLGLTRVRRRKKKKKKKKRRRRRRRSS